MLAIVASEKSYFEHILEKLKYSKEESLNNCKVYKCNHNNHEFILMSTGYAKVNIASSLRYICDKYNIKGILCIGTAGSVTDSNDIFSAVIPKSSLQFDVDFMPNGFMPGQVPYVNKAVYATDKDLNGCLIEACNSNFTNYSDSVIASSDMFVNNYNLANSVRMEYNAGAVDCESGTIGEFAYVNNIPYSCLKVISNFANNNALRQYKLYDDESSKICQTIAYKFIKELYKE